VIIFMVSRGLGYIVISLSNILNLHPMALVRELMTVYVRH